MELLQFSKEDLAIIIGYTLYDLVQIGYLSEAGRAFLNANHKFDSIDFDWLLNEVGANLNECLREKQEDGHVL